MTQAPTSRAELKETLLQITIEKIEQSGVHSVRARDLAKDAGCAVGTIYNLVGDLDNLILLASARTLEEFQEFALKQTSEAVEKGFSNIEILECMAAFYVDFAIAHKKRWQACFELNYAEGSDYHKTFTKGQSQLLGLIVKVLKDINPNVDQRELAAIGRALWASVHGISMMAIGNPTKTLSRDLMLNQCNRIIHPVIQALTFEART